MGGGMERGAVFGNYRIEEQVGAGGMSVLYRATDENLGRAVALKIMAPEISNDADFRDRFRREAQLASQIDHPNVLPIYAFGDEQDQLYIAMRFVEGSDLADFLRRSGALDPSAVHPLLTQICDALDAVHARGLIHRDVKPANVLLSGDERQAHAYLADFGLTRGVQGSNATQTGRFLGTLSYAAPEQLQGETVDRRSDVYSVGCLLFECLTGERPYVRDNEAALMYAHLSAPVPSITERNAELPAALDDVIGQAMAKDAAERFQTCGALLQAFRHACGFPAGEGPGAFVPAIPLVDPEVDVDAKTIQRSRDRRPAEPELRPESGGRRRGVLIGAVLAVLALTLGAIGIVALRGGDDPDRVEATGPDSDLEVDQDDLVTESPTVDIDGVRFGRTSVLAGPDGDALTAEVSLENTLDETVTVAHYEVIPKSMAESADRITFDDPELRVVVSDPVLGLVTTLSAGETRRFDYRVEVEPGPVDDERIARWDDDRAEAEQTFLASGSGVERLTVVAREGETLPTLPVEEGGPDTTGDGTIDPGDPTQTSGGYTPPTPGPGGGGNVVTTTATTPASNPGAPTNVVASVSSSGVSLVSSPEQTTVTISWSAPSNTGGRPITGYEVRYASAVRGGSSGTMQTKANVGAVNSATFTMPANHTAGGQGYYRYEVIATNSAGKRSNPAAARAQVPSVTGYCTSPSYQLMRAVGLVISPAGFAPSSPDACSADGQEKVYAQQYGPGTVRDAGSLIQVSWYNY